MGRGSSLEQPKASSKVAAVMGMRLFMEINPAEPHKGFGPIEVWRVMGFLFWAQRPPSPFSLCPIER
jgi:hypothetical protein